MKGYQIMALLLRNVRCVVTCDENDTVYEKVDIYCVDGIIRAIGKDLDVAAEQVVNCTDMLCYPGLVNTHHHFYRLFSRNLPKVQGMRLFDQLTSLYEIWKRLDPDTLYLSSRCVLALLLKSGCTTACDHHDVFPGEDGHAILDAQFSAADEMGVRFCAARGSMDFSKKDGGLPPDGIVQTTEAILRDSRMAAEKYHDPSFGAMHRVALAPCSPFSASADLYRESAALARALGVRLHTHLCETREEENFTLTAFKMRPLAYLQSLGFIGEDVWYAHAVHLNDDELQLLADTGTAVAHCPTSNMKLGSGIARIPDMLRLGIPVSLGMDGAASSDGGDMIRELRMAYLLGRVTYRENAPSAYECLKMATLGGARTLGRDDIGSIAVGKCADMFLIDKKRLDILGAAYSPRTMLAVVGLSGAVDCTIVNGRVVVQEGQVTALDEQQLFEQSHLKIKEYLGIL